MESTEAVEAEMPTWRVRELCRGTVGHQMQDLAAQAFYLRTTALAGLPRWLLGKPDLTTVRSCAYCGEPFPRQTKGRSGS